MTALSNSISGSSMQLLLASLLGCALPDMNGDNDDYESSCDYPHDDDNENDDNGSDTDETDSLSSTRSAVNHWNDGDEEDDNDTPIENNNNPPRRRRLVHFAPDDNIVWHENTLYHRDEAQALWYHAIEYQYFRQTQGCLIREIRAKEERIIRNNSTNHQLICNVAAPLALYNACCHQAGRGRKMSSNKNNKNELHLYAREDTAWSSTTTTTRTETSSRPTRNTPSVVHLQHVQRLAQWQHNHNTNSSNNLSSFSSSSSSYNNNNNNNAHTYCRVGLERISSKDIRQDILRRRRRLLDTIQDLQASCNGDDSIDDTSLFLLSLNASHKKRSSSSWFGDGDDDDNEGAVIDDEEDDKRQVMLRRACEVVSKPSVQFAIQVALAQAHGMES